jgi:hypothetical protein
LRRFGRIDPNQPAIVKGLRAFGATVQSLAEVGKGCPDILVGFQHRNYLFEIKDPNATDKRLKLLKPDQQEWHEAWRGQVTKIETLDEAIAVLQATL